MDGYGGSRATRSSRGPGGDRSVARSRLLRWLVAVAVSAVAAGSLPAVASASTAGGAPEASGQSGLPHGLGLVVTPSAAPSAAAVARVNTAAASLPASVDLTPHAAPVGDQGQVGSCAAWSTDYGALGYWENVEGIAGGGLEPMYTYSQLVNGQDTGSSIDANLQIAQQQGVDDQADYTQGNFDYVDRPTAAEKANAAHWKLTSFTELTIQQSKSSTVTQQSIKTALAAGNPVVIGIPVYANFESVTSANHGLYSSVSGPLLGYHAIAALGYNSTGLRIENSWTASWGDAGFATLSWSFVNTYVIEAVSVGPLVAAPPADTAPPTIAGTTQQGQQLTATSGTWTPAGVSYAYQWQRSTDGGNTWSAISGATATTYTLASADVGASVRVQVAAQGFGQSTTASSTFVGPIASAAPSTTVAPIVTGTARQAQALTARPARGPVRHVIRVSMAAIDHQRQRLVDDRRRDRLEVHVASADVAATSGSRDGHQQVRPRQRQLGDQRAPCCPLHLPTRSAGDHRHGARVRRSRPCGNLEPGGELVHVPVAALHRRRQHLVCDQRSDQRDVRLATADVSATVRVGRDGYEQLRDRQHQLERGGTRALRRSGQHRGAGGERDPHARGGADRELGDLEPCRQLVHLSVAALHQQRRQLVEHHERDELELHAGEHRREG